MALFGRRDSAAKGNSPSEPQHPPALFPSADGFARLRQSCIVYSNFRSGSHLLQSSLARLTRLRDVDEVFARQSDHALGFNAYLAEDHADPRALLLDPERHLPGYLRHLLDSLDHDQPLIFSLKYSQAHRLGADDLTGVPVILKVLADYRVPVLHLTRRDVVRQAISHLVAMETGRFDAGGGAGTQAGAPLWLDPAEVAALARVRAEEQRRARAHLQALSARHLTVHYEELAGVRVAAELRRTLRFLDRFAPVPDDFRPPTTAMDSDQRVANMTEIMDHLMASDPDLVQGLAF